MAAIATGTAVEGAGQGFIGLLDCLTELLGPPPRRRQRGGGRPRLHPPRPLRPRPGRGGRPAARALRRARCPGRGRQQLPLPGRAWAGSRRRGSCSPRTGSSAAELVALGLALRSCDPRAVLDETVELAARIAAHPRAATRAITSLMRGRARDAVLEANRREQGAFARLLGQRGSAGHPGRFRRPSPAGPDRAPRHHRRPHRPRPCTGRHSPRPSRNSASTRSGCPSTPICRCARTCRPPSSKACASTTTSAAWIRSLPCRPRPP